MTRVAVNGLTGRMGGAVVETAADRDVEVVVGFATSDVERAHGVPVVHPDEAADALREYDAEVVVDFAAPEGALTVADACAETGVAMVVGTTGFDEDGLDHLAAVSAEVPLLKASNFSQGIQVLQRLVGEAVRALDDYDLELMESHHNGKVDAPSGTANSILATIQEERDVDPVYGREGHAPRDEDEIGVFARRAGDIRGEHELILAGNDEVLSLSHRAEDRGVFAAGALDAATWLVGRDPGQYEFGEVVDAS
ncbi:MULTISPECIES: 4-hydroxy-tetrahydrodipicolinate reductase [Haloarcula]|uniref:4-hydroxy-tetrahydrodipicolinate reductase n=1 Tax=Haloarcula pellucida TaxID=1427151 RepID=A0A830GFW2_9EURY|nr:MULTISPECIES: 4-hydroxy-tetrahydrodipicolinate reductase [Halomicroarcula]MBX0346835.1 4-hydroxy-tetrahydrodipicolinate reductase [Halomicroarcula pellucida]MDS0277291.1 4-hydroxy-tetrahydrodipicolinate reductase [Halomicroarcula sp. S1AR25-4]GGN85700.1 4-hydroxy-tetrahydrodipicolinate reductase [Halomicroarcula pellucida]